jgi:4-oxalocrotonate tautomerase family enzyme
MPSVRVEILKGKAADYKKVLLLSIQEALVTALRVEEDNRCIRLFELDEDCFLRRASKTDKYTLVELTLLPGRSNELKKNAIEEITRLLGGRLEIQSSDIMIIIHEAPPDNWGCYGKPFSELDL